MRKISISSNKKYLIFILGFAAFCYLAINFQFFGNIADYALRILLLPALEPENPILFLFIPILSIFYIYSDYKFRGRFIFVLALQSIIKALISFSLWYVITTIFYAFIGGGIRSYYAPTFGLVGFFFFRYINQSLDWSFAVGTSYEGSGLSINYDLKNNVVKIKTSYFEQSNPLPGGYRFGFYTHTKWVSTSTTATTSRGDTVYIPTGGFLARTRKTTLVIDKYAGSDDPSRCDTLYYKTETEPNTYNSSTSYQINFNTSSIEGLKRFLDTMMKQWSRHYSETQRVLREIKIKEDAEKQIIENKRKADEALLKAEQHKISTENVRNQSFKLLNDWGIDPEGAFKTYHYRDNDGGYIYTMLAADKEGRGGAVLNEGKDTWSGSWKNAHVSEVGDTLEVQIDDPEYRQQHLKERRFAIKGFDKDERVEWIDRIRILSGHA